MKTNIIIEYRNIKVFWGKICQLFLLVSFSSLVGQYVV